MKRILSLLLVLTLLVPVFSLAEEEDLMIDEIVEDVVIDEDGNEVVVDEATGEAFLISSLDQDKLESLESRFETDSDVDPDTLEINPNLPDHVINILLLGVDVGKDASPNRKLLSEQVHDIKHADVQIILSYNTKDGSIKLSSIARNAYVEIPGRKNKDIISYTYGHVPYVNGTAGKFENTPELSIRTVNHNFELNIQYYVAMNFYGVASVIEYLGGVDINLTKAEARAINAYLKRNKSKISRNYDDKKGKRDALKAEDGVQHLDGIQGLMYARLRSVDNDRVRTSRTRHLLDCLLQNVVTKLKNRELDFLDLFSDLVQYPVTNMNAETMVSLASQVLRSGVMDKVGQVDTLVQEFRIPMDGTFQDTTVNGSSVTVFNLDENKQALHEFIYGQYIPST